MAIKDFDFEIGTAIENETRRQQDNLELIASENIVSKTVMQAQGSILTNKYAEGYPGRRYYGGCEFIDVVENLAIERAKKNYLVPSLLMFNHTLVRRPIPRLICH